MDRTDTARGVQPFVFLTRRENAPSDPIRRDVEAPDRVA